MRASDSAQELDVLRSCSTAMRDWYLSNNLLLNADKSQAIVLGTANQLRSATSIDSVEVAGVALAASRYNTEVARCHSRLATDIQRTR